MKIAATFIRYSDYIELYSLIGASNTSHNGLRTLSLLLSTEASAWEWYSYVKSPTASCMRSPQIDPVFQADRNLCRDPHASLIPRSHHPPCAPRPCIACRSTRSSTRGHCQEPSMARLEWNKVGESRWHTMHRHSLESWKHYQPRLQQFDYQPKRRGRRRIRQGRAGFLTNPPPLVRHSGRMRDLSGRVCGWR